jgi:hypothetical protein
MKAWIAGVLATIFSGVALYYIIPHPPVGPDSVAIAGSVVDASAKTVISDATVRLTVRGRPESQRTDSNGQYYFSIEGSNSTDSATLLVEATGYNPFSKNGSLLSLNDQSPNLTRIIPTAPGPGAVPGRRPVKISRNAAKIILPKYH